MSNKRIPPGPMPRPPGPPPFMPLPPADDVQVRLNKHSGMQIDVGGPNPLHVQVSQNPGLPFRPPPMPNKMQGPPQASPYPQAPPSSQPNAPQWYQQMQNSVLPPPYQQQNLPNKRPSLPPNMNGSNMQLQGPRPPYPRPMPPGTQVNVNSGGQSIMVGNNGRPGGAQMVQIRTQQQDGRQQNITVDSSAPYPGYTYPSYPPPPRPPLPPPQQRMNNPPERIPKQVRNTKYPPMEQDQRMPPQQDTINRMGPPRMDPRVRPQEMVNREPRMIMEAAAYRNDTQASTRASSSTTHRPNDTPLRVPMKEFEPYSYRDWLALKQRDEIMRLPNSLGANDNEEWRQKFDQMRKMQEYGNRAGEEAQRSLRVESPRMPFEESNSRKKVNVKVDLKFR